jgi:hypothetical protein
MLRKFDDANKHITSKREQVIRSNLSVNKSEAQLTMCFIQHGDLIMRNL